MLQTSTSSHPENESFHGHTWRSEDQADANQARYLARVASVVISPRPSLVITSPVGSVVWLYGVWRRSPPRRRPASDAPCFAESNRALAGGSRCSGATGRRQCSRSRGDGLGDAPPLGVMALVLRAESGPCLPMFPAARAVTGSKSSKKTAGLSEPTRNCAPWWSSKTSEEPASIES